MALWLYIKTFIIFREVNEGYYRQGGLGSDKSGRGRGQIIKNRTYHFLILYSQYLTGVT